MYKEGKMHYTKPPLNFNQQSSLLISRGLIARPDELEYFLHKVNYYRLTGYLYPFRIPNTDNYIPGTTLDQIKGIYYFDADLRRLTFSAIETIDIALFRTQMVEKFTQLHGSFCYTDHNCFNSSLSPIAHQNMMLRITQNVNRSQEEFIKSYRRKYFSEPNLPFWMVAETITFGQLSVIFMNLPMNILVPIAKEYNLHSSTLISWLHTLTNIRNISAHHARLWNRVLPIRPGIPSSKYHPEFHTPTRIKNDGYFIILGILKYMLDLITPDNSLIKDFNNLLVKFPDIPINRMGFPNNWGNFLIFK
ncbi:MAG: Abi family protein [Chloroflexi bacterium]|nr:Abi family protein [Chloroflexota bacterium]MBT5336758.1 Abi family protein [Chloroflexota bacterium]MBT6151779.1 Abi family protein [Chloroflexota bacterium]